MKKKYLYINLAATLLLTAGCGMYAKRSEPIVSVNEAEHTRMPSSYTVTQFPILEKLESSGAQLSDETKKWMKKWRDADLEDASLYFFDELSGSTSINLKVKKKDAKEPDGSKSMGSFVPRNGAANFDLEIAYFNMSAILGFDHIFRPAVRYELGPHGKQEFKTLIERYLQEGKIRGQNRLENKDRILKNIAKAEDLKGCLKAKKPDTEYGYDDMANPSAPPNGEPKSSHPVISFLQATNPKPVRGRDLVLKKGRYVGDEAGLVREYSVITVLDAVFQQWDRYSGGNIVIYKTEDGRAHFFFTDNGGADVSGSTSWEERNLGWFSRYDRKTIEKLKEVLAFLKSPEKGFLGYSNAEEFVVDLGLYSELKPKDYVTRLIRNLDLLMKRVEANEKRYGEMAYLDEI